MSNFSTAKQVVRPPQRGIFPLDHDAECKSFMEKYLECLKESSDVHYKCKDISRNYLQCRMDNQLMANENLDNLGFSNQHIVKGAHEYDKAKEKAGYIAGKHIHKQNEWWFKRIFKSNEWKADTTTTTTTTETTTTETK